MARERRTSIAAAILIFQAALGGGWWMLVGVSEGARHLFFGQSHASFLITLLAAADLSIFVGGGAVAAILTARRHRWAWTALCVHAGGVAYATFIAVSLAFMMPRTWPGAAMMAASLATLIVISAALWKPLSGATHA